ncbi:hypothetical protein NPX13_g7630 [Xylaria arbuscula]|uniref:C2H2-type domain-containing protein n=1 Tax=Xylaria arbuscula TaxID=114810 RepID=A0A9W8N9N5_9PEZI|nr:hypothetical protein NPX13_g7630 [Xylaria arbuscula]
MSFNWHGSNGHLPDDLGFQSFNMQSQPMHQFPSPDGPTVYDCLPHSSPPPFRDYVPSPTSPENGCSFRHEVVDECYKSRFWSRALEYYLLENQQQGSLFHCLMENCPERDFKDPRAMLRHLKHCKLFSNGKFWCPACQKVESFKVVSKRKCSWDRVNVARKLYQKSLKVLQRISGHRGRPGCCCDCHVSQNSALVRDWLLSPPDLPMPPAESGRHSSSGEQSATVTPSYERFELSSNMIIPELNAPNNTTISELSARRSNYMSNLETLRHSLYHAPAVPQTPYHQVSPMSPETLGQSGYSSGLSSACTDHTTESPVLGCQFPAQGTAVILQPFPVTREGSQISRRGDVPLLTVDTRQSASNVQPTPEYSGVLNRLLNEGETLGPSMDMCSLIPAFTPITTPQPNEMCPFSTHPVPEAFLVPQTIELQPSPSVSLPSQSNSDISPSSMSSASDFQCQHPGCNFRPSGIIQNHQAYMRKHLKNHKNNVIPCEHCDKTFTRQDNLTSHNRKMHPEFWLKRSRGSSDSLRSADQPKRKESRREAQRVS